MTASAFDTHILTIVCNVFDAHAVALFLPDEEESTHYLAGAYCPDDAVSPSATATAGRGLVGWILRNRQPLLVPNFDQPQGNLGYYDEEREPGVKAFMGCPIPTGGALCVDSRRQYSFSDKDHKTLQLFAEVIAGQLLSRGRQDLAGDIPRYFAELGVIQDLRFRYKRWPQFIKNFVHTLAEATAFDYCAFASVNEPGENFCVECESVRLLLNGEGSLILPMGSGLAGWVFRNDQPVVAEATEHAPVSAIFGNLPDMPEFKAAICMPVVVNKGTRGVICLAHTSPRQMDESLRSFVRQAVDHLGLFLENLYLKTRLRSLLPKARVHSEGAPAYDPDHAPMHSRHEP